MGIILGALGGMGEQAASIGSTLMKSELDKEKMGMESDLALQRSKALETFKESLRTAPLTRLGTTAQRYAGEEVPQEPAKVTQASGHDPQLDNGGYVGSEAQKPSKGLVGEYADLVARAKTLPIEDQQPYLDQLKRQFGYDKNMAEGIVAGQTRKRTPDEALTAAAEDMKVNDPVAYAEYEAKIGKPRRDERRVDNQEMREQTRWEATTGTEKRKADADARKYEVELRRLDIQSGNLDASNRKIDAMIEHWDRSDENKAKGKAGTPERMGSIVNAMNATIKNLDDNKPSASKPEADRLEWQTQRTNAMAVRARAMAKLNSNFDDGTPTPTPAPAAPATAPPTAGRPPLSNFMK